jgi:DNA-binding GntR family transcriptional regulator
MSRKQQVYEYLLEAILSNSLPPGSPIIETEIATALRTSRTPVREALKELEKDGLVSQYSQKGTFVSEITPHDVEEIFNLRIMLEVSALQLVYNKISEEELNKVESMFASLDADSTSEAFAIADKSLHALIVDKAGNYRLKQFLSILNVQIERFRRIAAMEPTRLRHSKKEHLEIVDMLRKRDLNACEASLKNHLNNVKKSTLETAKLLLMERVSGKFIKS